jgi:DeoR/GlpR family transcriptional regulator of sugar metabolism
MTERQKKIVGYVERNLFATFEELSEVLSVSPVTVRRDVSALDCSQQVRKIHGGIVPIREGDANIDLRVRMDKDPEEKTAIARKAASLIERDDVIFVDSGSTCHFLSLLLDDSMNLTVVTHSLDAVYCLREKERIRVIVIGGEWDRKLNSLNGLADIKELRYLTIHKAFIGVTAIHYRTGCSDNSILERQIKQTMHRNARASYLLADSTKFDKTVLYPSIVFEEMGRVITTTKTRGLPDFEKNYLGRGIEFTFAEIP